MVIFDSLRAAHLMRVVLSYAMTISGVVFAMMPGVMQMPVLSADNLDSHLKVRTIRNIIAIRS